MPWWLKNATSHVRRDERGEGRRVDSGGDWSSTHRERRGEKREGDRAATTAVLAIVVALAVGALAGTLILAAVVRRRALDLVRGRRRGRNRRTRRHDHHGCKRDQHEPEEAHAEDAESQVVVNDSHGRQSRVRRSNALQKDANRTVRPLQGRSPDEGDARTSGRLEQRVEPAVYVRKATIGASRPTRPKAKSSFDHILTCATSSGGGEVLSTPLFERLRHHGRRR